MPIMIHLPQMLLQLPSNNLFFHSNLPKIQNFQNPKKLRQKLFLIRASVSSDTQTLPQSAIRRIAEKLRSLGYIEDDDRNKQPSPTTEEALATSPGEIFVPLPNRLPKYRVGHTLDPSWSTPEYPVPEPGSGSVIRRDNKKKEEEGKSRATEKVPTLAELKLPVKELRRLRKLGIELTERLKIGKAGITEGIVNGIHERWRRTELVKIVCQDISKLNMKRTHDLLERKTGGLVVWRSGSIIVLYRGAEYKYPYFSVDNAKPNDASGDDSTSSSRDYQEDSVKESYPTCTGGETSTGQNKTAQPPLIQGVGSRTRVRFQLPGEAQLAEEADQLLQGLGPRFVDWYGYDPKPVDADLLPAIVPGYRKPFRLLPYGVHPILTNDEMTILRRLGRPLPYHFALGRNRNLQGLAAAILKLWEKCEIAKIAIKRGVEDADSEQMTEELKWLTGGSVLARDKEHIVLYRGKDFLPPMVSSAIEQRRSHGINRIETKKISSSSDAQVNKDEETELLSASKDGGTIDQKLKVAIERKKVRSNEAAIKKTSAKLSQALMRKESAEKLLAELQKQENSELLEVDKEHISEEERYMLRKVGLKMKPFLLLGRRGVFDGTVENMHLHWKYRELVKILCGEKNTKEAHAIAKTLEAESGGILVVVERVAKGHIIIVYRGKNYKRPSCLRPQTLLNKREALKRSIEAQRQESLKLHVLKLGRNVEELKLKLEQDKEKSQSAEYMEPDTDHELSKSSLTSKGQVLNVASGVTKLEAETSTDSGKTRQRHVLTAIKNGNRYGRELTKANSKATLVKGTEGFVEMDSETEEYMLQSTTATCPDDIKLEGSTSSLNLENTAPCVSVTMTETPFVDSPVHRTGESNEKTYRAALLSNKERLLLRKQALKMRKRPVLAVGKSNIVSGVAKTIRTHFKKHPLAIVNIKGRAKGTSVQEVVSELEEATGAIFVSQEPNKVILYRGWGATEDADRRKRNEKGVLTTDVEVSVKPIISPELISAIRLECGLQLKHDDKKVD